MGTPERSFRELIDRVRLGCEDASRELYERYNEKLLWAIRRRMLVTLRRRYESADFTQSVWKTFFEEPGRYNFSTPEELIAFLRKVAANKMIDAARKQFGKGRPNPSLAEPVAEQGDEPPFSNLPTPSQELMAEEFWERLQRNQPEKYKNVLALLRLGHRKSHVARRLGIPETTIYRLLERLERLTVRPAGEDG